MKGYDANTADLLIADMLEHKDELLAADDDMPDLIDYDSDEEAAAAAAAAGPSRSAAVPTLTLELQPAAAAGAGPLKVTAPRKGAAASKK